MFVKILGFEKNSFSSKPEAIFAISIASSTLSGPSE